MVVRGAGAGAGGRVGSAAVLHAVPSPLVEAAARTRARGAINGAQCRGLDACAASRGSAETPPAATAGQPPGKRGVDRRWLRRGARERHDGVGRVGGPRTRRRSRFAAVSRVPCHTARCYPRYDRRAPARTMQASHICSTRAIRPCACVTGWTRAPAACSNRDGGLQRIERCMERHHVRWRSQAIVRQVALRAAVAHDGICCGTPTAAAVAEEASALHGEPLMILTLPCRRYSTPCRASTCATLEWAVSTPRRCWCS